MMAARVAPITRTSRRGQPQPPIFVVTEEIGIDRCSDRRPQPLTAVPPAYSDDVKSPDKQQTDETCDK